MRTLSCAKSWLLILALALGPGGCDNDDGAGIARNGPEGMLLWAQPRPLANARFLDAAGRRLSLADFRGKVVLLNLWATWCAPCREEMPALDSLQRQLGGPAFQVMALSLDQGGIEQVQKFYRDFGIEHLDVYLDDSETAGPVPDAPGIPVTLLLDREGRELGRKLGVAHWDSAAMQDFIRGVIAQPPAG